MPFKVFLTGASGYIGGSVLSELLKFPDKYTVSALIRKREYADILQEHGVTPVFGSLDDAELLTRWAKESDAVIHAADYEHLCAVQAIVKGLKEKEDKGAVFIHTSSTTGIILPVDQPASQTYDDMNMESVKSIPRNLPYRLVDDWIFENCKDITAAIVAPSVVHGIGSGLFNKISIYHPGFFKAGMERRRPGLVGNIANQPNVVFGNVNIHDLADLFQIVLEESLSNTIESEDEVRFYFGSAKDHSWVEFAQAVGKILHNRGLVDTIEVSQFEPEYVDKYFPGGDLSFIWAGDSRCVANRSRKIGWAPKYPDIFGTLEQEVNYVLEKSKIK